VHKLTPENAAHMKSIEKEKEHDEGGGGELDGNTFLH